MCDMLMAASGGDGLYEQLVRLEMTELLWSLCEILLIDIVPGSSTLYLRFPSVVTVIDTGTETAVLSQNWAETTFFCAQLHGFDARL